MYTSIISTLSFLTLIGTAVVFFLVLVIIFKKHPWAHACHLLIGKYALEFAFIVTLVSAVGSLFLSEVIGFDPCVLCWVQRLFMYPQLVILGVAIVRKDFFIMLYSIILSAIGALVAFYHMYVQLGGTSLTPCTSVGGSCAKVFILEYGFVTIPTMSLVAFLLIILCLYIGMAHHKTD